MNNFNMNSSLGLMTRLALLRCFIDKFSDDNSIDLLYNSIVTDVSMLLIRDAKKNLRSKK